MAMFHRAWPTDELPQPSVRGRPASQPVALVAAGPEAARAMIWGLEAGGWSEREAGNLVGLLHGLRPARAGWSEREIEHLRFLRALVDSGRLDH